jgi:hypothetical protein
MWQARGAWNGHKTKACCVVASCCQSVHLTSPPLTSATCPTSPTRDRNPVTYEHGPHSDLRALHAVHSTSNRASTSHCQLRPPRATTPTLQQKLRAQTEQPDQLQPSSVSPRSAAQPTNPLEGHECFAATTTTVGCLLQTDRADLSRTDGGSSLGTSREAVKGIGRRTQTQTHQPRPTRWKGTHGFEARSAW